MISLPLSRLLIAGVVAGMMGVTGMLMSPSQDQTTTNIRLHSTEKTHSVGDVFTVAITAESFTPVNVFKGLITFDSDVIQISSINYNTSLIDLWAEEPWYSNGEGTLSFTGGTTITGGFTGKGILFTITFTAKSPGQATLSMQEIRILKHDGLGSDTLVDKPIDSIFLIESELPATTAIAQPDLDGPILHVLPTIISTDLNQDGKQSIADVSIFMKHLATKNLASDFDQDGVVGLKDLSILMK